MIMNDSQCAQLPWDDIPAALAELEHAKARLLQRLLTCRPASPPASPLLRIADVATYLNVPETQVRALAHLKQGGLPFIKIGKHYRISKAALLEWEMDRQQKALEVKVSPKYTHGHGRAYPQTPTHSARMDAKTTRTRASRPQIDGEQVGIRRSSNHTDDGKVH